MARTCTLNPIVLVLLLTTALLALQESFRLHCHAFQPSVQPFFYSQRLPLLQRLSTTKMSGSGTGTALASAGESSDDGASSKPFCEHVLFVECGFGNDSHGQNPTKAAVRACRNSIEFNSIPSINRLVPGGYDNLKLDIILAIPPKYQEGLDLEAVANVFPYGETKFTIQDGGMVAPSGIAIDSLGDKNDDMVVVCCSVTVGY
jgi:uncharacterized protein (TIGR02058 family)